MAYIYDYKLEQLDDLEGTPLPQFEPQDAWKIGSYARELALSRHAGKSVVIDVRLPTGHILFRTVTGEDSAWDNDEWVRRKSQTVFRFGKSSFYWGQKLRLKGNLTIEQNNFVSEVDYATHGGSVPIRVKGVAGVVGTLTISGLAQEDDHLLALEVLKKFT